MVVLLFPGNMGAFLGGLIIKSFGALFTYLLATQVAESLDHIEWKNNFGADEFSASVSSIIVTIAAVIGQSILLAGFICKKMEECIMKYGIQMYLFRDECKRKEQTLQTLKRVADMGWDGIELFQCTDIPASDIRDAVGKCDILNPMLWAKNFEPDKIQKTCVWLKELGAKEAAYNVIPVLRPNAKAYRKYNPKYQQIAAYMAKNGLTFCHHNHKEEFKVKGGRVGLDILMENVEHYCLEIDTYWAMVIGYDVVALMEERKEHLRYIHLKDRKNGAKKFCPLGEGDVSNCDYVDKAIELGLEYVIVDLDNSDGDVFAAAEKSYAWLHRNFG